MKKQFSILSVTVVLLAMVSCENKSIETDGIFGEIPAKMFELEEESKTSIKDELGIDVDREMTREEMTAIISNQETSAKLNEIHEKYRAKLNTETSELCEKMKGNTLPYEMGDNLDYSFEKAPVIKEVQMTNGNPKIIADMDIIFTNDINGVSDYAFNYFLTDGEMPLKAEKGGVLITKELGFEEQAVEKPSLWAPRKYNIKKGNKMHVTLVINNNAVVPVLLAKYKKLKFVSENEYIQTDVNANAKRVLEEIKKK